MNRKLNPTSSGWAIIVLSAAVLALGGCGRKGGLDLPPNAASQASSAASPDDTDVEVERAAQGAFNPSSGTTDPSATAPRGRKRSFVLDPLLD
ncbi:MAG: lipoprotein [Bradyrhizobium sp.]|nr:lipoprotein [Bradyrhizobium sp.]